MKSSISTIIIMLISCGVAEGLKITEVQVANVVSLNYDSVCGVLGYDVNDGAQAYVLFDDITDEIFTSVDITSSHQLTFDTSSGGEASGSFDAGSISIQISGPMGDQSQLRCVQHYAGRDRGQV